MDRRKFLSKPATSNSAEEQKRSYFTNAVLTTHEGRQVKFYDDLIRGKIVIINMMYAKCEGICPAAATNLKRVQEGLKGRIGRDTFLYSITLKPEQDDAEALMHFTHMRGIKPPGWLFLTGDADEIETIRFRLFRWDQPGLDNDVNQHTGMLFLHNDNLSRNCKTPALGSVRQILETISWLDPVPVQAARARKNAAQEVERLNREAAWARGERWAKDAVTVLR